MLGYFITVKIHIFISILAVVESCKDVQTTAYGNNSFTANHASGK